MTKTNAVYICSKDEHMTKRQIAFLKTYAGDNAIVYYDNTLDDYHKTGYAALTIDIQLNRINKLYVISLESLSTNLQKIAALGKILDNFKVKLFVVKLTLSESPVCIKTVDDYNNSNKITVDD